MRVVHLINDLRVGGAERLVVDLVPRFRAAGVDTEAAPLGSAGSYLLDSLKEGGVSAIPAAALHLPPAPLPLRSPRQIARIMRLLRNADIAHIHLFPAQLWAAVAVSLLPLGQRPHLVTTEHNTTNRRRGNPAFRALDQWMYRRYARIAAVSEAVEKSLIDWQPSTAGKTCVVHSAVDIEAYRRALPASKAQVLGVSDTTPVIVCVGRYEAQKDQATLVRALSHLPEWHAAFVGDGELRPVLEKAAAAIGVAPRVHLLGRRADVPELLAMADVYVQPSLYEGWSASVLEAMASGRAPLVVSRAPGLLDAVEGRGLLFPIGDAVALAEQVKTLYADPLLSADLKRKASLWVQGFRIENCVAGYLALYQDVMAQTPPSRRQ